MDVGGCSGCSPLGYNYQTLYIANLPSLVLLHHRRHLLPLRPADLHHEVRVLDLHWRPGQAQHHNRISNCLSPELSCLSTGVELIDTQNKTMLDY